MRKQQARFGLGAATRVIFYEGRAHGTAPKAKSWPQLFCFLGGVGRGARTGDFGGDVTREAKGRKRNAEAQVRLRGAAERGGRRPTGVICQS